ncbi:type III secretion system export apparatus subunit SctR [Futiania mangrovi]|uniref:Type III secretion system export apparatus subunit SctR n=1 Tax=Futiania mangrovi TaxID=2959716 RepID=A0A9J6PJT6_9PROT|nr:type III secretion system export apparatus subunit SctR [Futiania mangrovii]MCP1336799.1 type III secretion system export apparatus subunit SctR [Futiania mangrovii]
MEPASFNFVGLIALTTAISLLPFLAVLVTGFTKIVVVLLIVRNALGIQGVPSNLVVNALAIILAIYVTSPMLNEITAALTAPGQEFETIEDWTAAGEAISAPIKEFLTRYTSATQRAFFVDAIVTVSTPPGTERPEVPPYADDSFFVLVPAFVVAELTRAFEIGFLLYLPLIAVDLIITAILMALGMMMVSPIILSVPFKLFLFVVADGWTRLAYGLVLSYTPGGG